MDLYTRKYGNDCFQSWKCIHLLEYRDYKYKFKSTFQISLWCINLDKDYHYLLLTQYVLYQVRFMAARASVAFITDQVEEVKQRQFVDLVPGIVQVTLRLINLIIKLWFSLEGEYKWHDRKMNNCNVQENFWPCLTPTKHN